MIEVLKELQGKRVLVTGASGFIGSRLVKVLIDSDVSVVGLVYGEANLRRLWPVLDDRRLELVFCPLADTDAVASQKARWAEVDMVVHMALCVPSATSFSEQIAQHISLNLLPTLNLVNTLPDSVMGICFASSVVVYGSPVRLPVKECDLPRPVSGYGLTKLTTENYLVAYGQTKGIPVTVLRYATVFGPGEFNHRAVPRFIHALSKGQPPLIYGDGSEIRDYVYVDDVVQATVCALARRPGQVLNIGSGKGHSTMQIAQELIKIYGADVKPLHLPRVEENMNITCDITAAAEALGYIPQTRLEEGLQREVEWHQHEVADKRSLSPERRR